MRLEKCRFLLEGQRGDDQTARCAAALSEDRYTRKRTRSPLHQAAADWIGTSAIKVPLASHQQQENVSDQEIS